MLFADEAHLTAWKKMCAVQGKSASHSVLHIQEHSKVLVGKQMVIVVLLAPSREVIVLGWWTPLSPYALWPTSLEQLSVVSPSIWILELFTSPSAGFSFRQENKGSFSLLFEYLVLDGDCSWRAGMQEVVRGSFWNYMIKDCERELEQPIRNALSVLPAAGITDYFSNPVG